MTISAVKNGVKEITLKGKPQDAQVPFFKARNQHICYGGARGGGKSWAMRRKFILLACRYKGLKLLLLRNTYPEVESNHILPMTEELVNCGLAKYNDSKKRFTFINGSTIKLGYCNSMKDAFQYQGQEFDVIGLEEATEFREEWATFILTANRSTRTDFTARAYYTCNPGGVGHEWVKRLFIDRQFEEGETPEDYIFIPAKVDDNEYLRDTDYKKRLMALDEDLRRAHLDGDWDVFAGQAFREFNRDKHICDPFEIPSNWARFRGLDYGQDMTACYWFAVDTVGTVYIYRELYEAGLILSEAARRILAVSAEEVEYTVASPDLWNRRQETGKSGMRIMFEAGLRDLVKANDARIPGWRVLREYLHCTPDNEPRLKIVSTCTNLIRTLPQLQYDKRRIEDVAKEPHEITHGAEAVRYGLMSRVPKGKETERKEYPIGYLTEDIGQSGDEFGGIGGFDSW